MSMGSFQVVEANLCSRSGGRDGGDDVLVVTPHFVAVLDGASDDSGAIYNGIGAARFVATVGANAIRSLAPSATAHEAVTQMSEAVALALAHTVPNPQPCRPPCFVFALYSSARHEIWRVGDVKYLIDGKGNNPEFAVDTVIAQVRRMITRAYLTSGEQVNDLRRDDPGRGLIKPLLVLQTRFMNTHDSTFAYGAVSGGTIPEALIEVIKVPEDAGEVVLASDGYPQIRQTLEQSEAWLEHVLQHDPLFIEIHPAVKGQRLGAASFDDRSYVRINLKP